MLRFRNYAVKDKTIAHTEVAPARAPEFAPAPAAQVVPRAAPDEAREEWAVWGCAEVWGATWGVRIVKWRGRRLQTQAAGAAAMGVPPCPPPPPLSQDVLAAVAPKKPAWDLKRDLQPRLDKLERRTQRAIADILREQARGRGSSGFRPRQPPARCPPTPTAARYRPSHPPTAPLPQERAQLAADGGPRE